MKLGIHPTLHRVCSMDLASGKRILTFTGEERFIDSAGRMDKINRRDANRKATGRVADAR